MIKLKKIKLISIIYRKNLSLCSVNRYCYEYYSENQEYIYQPSLTSTYSYWFFFY